MNIDNETIQTVRSKKISIIKEAYLNVELFFWNHSNDHEPVGSMSRKRFNECDDISSELDNRFVNGDFKSEEDRAFLEDHLEKMYYEIVKIDPETSMVFLLHPVIVMIEKNEDHLEWPR